FVGITACSAPKETDKTTAGVNSSQPISEETTVDQSTALKQGQKQKLETVSFDPNGEPKYHFEEIKHFSELDPSNFLDEWKEGHFLLAVTPDDFYAFKGEKENFREGLSPFTLASYNLKDNELTALEPVSDPDYFIRLAWADESRLVWVEVTNSAVTQDTGWKLMTKHLPDGSSQSLLDVKYDEASREKRPPVDLFPESMVVQGNRAFLIYPAYEKQNWNSVVAYVDLENGRETVLEKTALDQVVHAQLSLEKEAGKAVIWNRLSEVNQEEGARTAFKVCAICSWTPDSATDYRTVAEEGYDLSPLQYGDRYYAVEPETNPPHPDQPKDVIVEIQGDQKKTLIEHELSTLSDRDSAFSLFDLVGNKRFMGALQSAGLPVLYEPAAGKLVEVSDYKVEPGQDYRLVQIFDHHAIFRLPGDDGETGNFSIVHLPE
ncbi:MAG: hypothetical protein SPI72_07560, partial [Porphyromonas sp.]|nr:hypothetical protein [Porphyromonas sp.]